MTAERRARLIARATVKRATAAAVQSAQCIGQSTKVLNRVRRDKPVSVCLSLIENLSLSGAPCGTRRVPGHSPSHSPPPRLYTSSGFVYIQSTPKQSTVRCIFCLCIFNRSKAQSSLREEFSAVQVTLFNFTSEKGSKE